MSMEPHHLTATGCHFPWWDQTVILH